MRALLVSDLHYDLRQPDWVLDQVDEVDLLVVAGDMLDVAGAVPLDAQIVVVLEYLARLAERTTAVACSGNHDLDHRTPSGEKATAWLQEARSSGVVVDGDTTSVEGWTVSACAWWEGPDTLAVVERRLEEAAQRDPGARWLWAWHGPPEGPLAWTGTRHFGDPELPRLLEAHRPDVVLCGHIHEAPQVEGGGWAARHGSTWLFNSGRHRGPVPAHVRLDLAAGRARWWPSAGSDELELGLEPSAPTAQV